MTWYFLPVWACMCLLWFSDILVDHPLLVSSPESEAAGPDGFPWSNQQVTSSHPHCPFLTTVRHTCQPQANNVLYSTDARILSVTFITDFAIGRQAHFLLAWNHWTQAVSDQQLHTWASSGWSTLCPQTSPHSREGGTKPSNIFLKEKGGKRREFQRASNNT